MATTTQYGRVVYKKKDELIKAVRDLHGLEIHEVCIMALDIVGSKGCKQFMYFMTPHERHGFIGRNYGPQSDKHAYEVIPEMDIGHKVYIVWDIDRKLCMMDDTEQWMIKNFQEAKANIVDSIMNYFAAFTRDRMGIVFEPQIGTNVQIAHAEEIDTKPLEKLSIHVRMNILCKCWTDVKTITESFIQYLAIKCTPEEYKLLFTVKQDKNQKFVEDKCIIDTSIYSKFRSMRKLYQSKGTPGALILLPYGASSTSPEDHEVIYNEHTCQVDNTMDISDKPVHIQGIPATDLTGLMKKGPKLRLFVQRPNTKCQQKKCKVPVKTIDAVKELIESSEVTKNLLKHDNPKVSSIERHEHTVDFIFSPCTGCACPAKGSCHSSNRFYLQYNHNFRSLKAICFNEKCQAILEESPIKLPIQNTMAIRETHVAAYNTNTMGCMHTIINWTDKYTEESLRSYNIYVQNEQGQHPDSITCPEDPMVKSENNGHNWWEKQDIAKMENTHEYENGSGNNDKEVLRSMIAIKAQMGLGKTEQLIADLQHVPPETSMLVITHSRVFSNKMKAELETLNFQCYLDAERGQISDHRVVCCLDSLPRLKLPSENGYDIVIIDELLSVETRAGSPFMRHDEVFAHMEYILRNSNTLVFMDAYVDNTACYQFIKYLENLRDHECRWIHNEYVRPNNRVCQLILNRTSKQSAGHKRTAIRAIISELQAGKRVVVPSSSKTFIKDLMARVAKLNEDGTGKTLKVASYTADTPPEELAKAIKDPHEAWRDLDLLAYSPTITSGISFKESHFDCLIAYAENSAKMPLIDAVLQQLFRVRCLSDAPEDGHNGANMRVFLNDTRKVTPSDMPLSLATIERDLDRKVRYKLGAFQDGKWEIPEYLVDTGDTPTVPLVYKAGQLFPMYDKDRLSYIMLIGMIYLRNKSACYYTDIMINTLRTDYGIKTNVTCYNEEDADNTEKAISRDANDSYIVPFCNDLILPDREAAEVIRGTVYGPEEKTDVKIINENDGFGHWLTVPMTVLQRSQLFTFKMAQDYYKLREPVDRRFFETFITDASTANGQKDAIARFFAWKRFCRLRMTLQENREIYAANLIKTARSKERNFKLYYDTNLDKYEQMVIYGQELLLALCGSTENTRLLDIGEHKYIMLRETFKDRVDAYMTRVTETKFKSMVDLFEFRNTRYNSKKTLTSSQKGVSHFIKKILLDAFNIDFTEHGSRKKCIDASAWQVLKGYGVDYDEWDEQ